MIGYLHLMALNPNTARAIRVNRGQLRRRAPPGMRRPPGPKSSARTLVTLTEQTWTTLGE